jgi:hypothetical protein
MDKGVKLYGWFSPHVWDSSSLSLSALPYESSISEGEAIAAVAALVLQIMPDLQELCGSPIFPLPADHVEVDLPSTLCSLMRSYVIVEPLQPPLALNPDAFFAK